MYNNFEILLVVFMPNITTTHAITYTNKLLNIGQGAKVVWAEGHLRLCPCVGLGGRKCVGNRKSTKKSIENRSRSKTTRDVI